MQIQLCEDDGLFHEGGVPTMVVIMVKFDDGKTKRFPYPADKPISALYMDLNAVAPRVEDQKIEISPLQEAKMGIMIKTVEDNFIAAVVKDQEQRRLVPAAIDKSNIIEKEDIVTLIKLNPRDTVYSGTMSPLMVGMDYRVITVIGPKIPTADGKGIRQVIQGFEVIDDTAPTPERMVVTPDEVQLKSKRLSKIIEKVNTVEEIIPCPNCQVNNSLTLKGTDFVGTCEACSTDISIARIIRQCAKCSTPKLTKDVSCFDVGGKYEGQCGDCKSKIEVPYA